MIQTVTLKNLTNGAEMAFDGYDFVLKSYSYILSGDLLRQSNYEQTEKNRYFSIKVHFYNLKFI